MTLRNRYGMDLQFQHISTSTHRAAGSTYITLYGRSSGGGSVAVHVHDVKPYAYVKCSFKQWQRISRTVFNMIQWEESRRYIELLEKKKKDDGEEIYDTWFRTTWTRRCFEQCMLGDKTLVITKDKGYNIRQVHEGPPDEFIKVTASNNNILRTFVKCLRNPEEINKSVYKFRDLLSRKKSLRGEEFELPSYPTALNTEYTFDVFETHIPFDLVWMINNKMTACGWMETRILQDSEPKTSCAIEGNALWIKKCEAPKNCPIAPFKILSYDIESQPHEVPGQIDTEFPEPERDPILCIGVCVFNMSEQDKIEQHAFMWEPKGTPCKQLTELTPDEQTDEYRAGHTHVHSYRSEYDMLEGFAFFIREECDPDIITGYNVLNFDNVYFIERAKALWQLDETGGLATCLGRVPNVHSKLKKKYKFSNQKGGSETWECSLEGREFMDLYKVIKDDHNLRSYKLDNVAKEFLGTEKIHIDYNDIPKMQRTPEGRVKLSVYCVKDAWLPCILATKLCKIINALLMSQVTSVSLNAILNRGQQIRTLALMLRKCIERKENGQPRWFIPDEDKPPNTGSFEGAVVITPKPGFYEEPVATLDFASLYPSIMIAYNMCFSTIMTNHKEAKKRGYTWYKDDPSPTYRPVRAFDYPEGGRFEYKESSTDVCFITADQRRGILPELLEELGTERKIAKKQRKAYSENSMEYGVLDGRQLALKVCMNSMYGFCGASRGYLPEKRIASSVTRVGRGMANETKFMCEDRYKEYGVQVVYGDTDSVFVHFPKKLCWADNEKEYIEKANVIGEEMATMCTKAFLPPNDLEFEKVYYPLLLKGKKRYAGYKFEPGLKPKLDVKGFECVRRDFAPLVSKTQKEVLIRMVQKRDTDSAVQYARQKVQDLLDGNVPISELTISKQLTRPPDQYKNPAPHVELAKYLQKILPPTQAPKTGERINYVIKPGNGRVFERAARPEDVIDGKESIDAKWYLQNQLREPLLRIFEMVMDNALDIFKINSYKRASVGSNSYFSQWVTGKRKTTSRKSSTIEIKKKKKKKTASGNIRSFFPV